MKSMLGLPRKPANVRFRANLEVRLERLQLAGCGGCPYSP